MNCWIVELQGLAGVPRDRTAAARWLAAAGVPIYQAEADGRRPQYVRFADLPAEVRRAYELQRIEASGLEPGTHDEEAHARFLEATPAMQAIALRKAEIARFLLKANGGTGVRLTNDLATLARARFGEDGTDKMTLRRILRAVEGIDPVNFAPALLPSFCRTGAVRAAMCEEAWSLFLTIIRDAGPQFPLRQAWRDVRDLKGKRGWAWPDYQTVWRRWNALSEAQRMVARQGKDAAAKALSVPVLRDKTTIKPLDWVSLDGRTLDFWVDFGDGKAVRPVMVALVDVASNFVLGYELARSENAVTTARVIRSVCEKYGIFQRLYTDNGSAFAGHLVAGGAKFKWRGKGRATPAVRPLGVCFHLGIELTFAIPKNAQAKIAERTFRDFSRSIDDRPEFRGAHAGHAPGASPTKDVVPVPFDVAEAIVKREVDRHNSVEGRRSQGARRRSYAQVFQDGLVGRIPTRATAAQLYYASLKYTPASVDRWGRVQIDTWTYGDATSQSLLMPWHGKGQILIGCDPDNLGAPAVAFDDAGHLIATSIPAVSAGIYGSVEGKREAARNRKAARNAAAQAEAANNYLHDQEFAAALAALDAPPAGEAASSTSVVGGALWCSPQADPAGDRARRARREVGADRRYVEKSGPRYRL